MSAPGPSKRAPSAPGAAGKIHPDFERGFIRAEIVAFDDLSAGSMTACKERAWSAARARLRDEGRRRDAVPVQRVEE
jgi:ribosome-binding ATPase YchF (GTP1/OBG family)